MKSIFFIRHIALLISILAFFAGCAQKRPVLYPNYHLKAVGMDRAEADIRECMRLAREYGIRENRGGKIAKRTAGNATVGAAAASAGAAVLGGNVGRSAAAGAAGSGAATLTRGIFTSDSPDPLFKRYVERCLQDKRYSVIGWR